MRCGCEGSEWRRGTRRGPGVVLAEEAPLHSGLRSLLSLFTTYMTHAQVNRSTWPWPTTDAIFYRFAVYTSTVQLAATKVAWLLAADPDLRIVHSCKPIDDFVWYFSCSDGGLLFDLLVPPVIFFSSSPSFVCSVLVMFTQLVVLVLFRPRMMSVGGVFSFNVGVGGVQSLR